MIYNLISTLVTAIILIAVVYIFIVYFLMYTAVFFGAGVLLCSLTSD